MKNTPQEKGGAYDPAKRPNIESLPKMEMYAVLGLELSKQILERLGKIEDSIEILMRQKKRELDRKGPETSS